MSKLVYSSDRVAIVRVARNKGLSDRDILSALVANEYGDANRKKIIEDWAAALGLTKDEALRIAGRTGLIKPPKP